MTAWFNRHRLDLLLILCILIAGSLALFFNIGNLLPLYPWSDESEIAADAVATLAHGPQLFYPNQLAGGSLAVWLEAGWMALFGKSLLGLRIFNGFINLASAVLLYLFVLQLPLMQINLRRAIGFIAAMLFAVSIWLLGLGRIATPNWSLVPLMTTLTFYLFWLGLNTKKRRYFILAGVVMGLLFYGYIPGYFVPLVLVLFLLTIWLLNKLWPPDVRLHLTLDALLPFLSMLVVAAPILVYFVRYPEATLQRPLQLADTNELSGASLMAKSILDMLSTFGFYPNWLLQGDFTNLAFDPLVTVLFVAGLLVALWHWRHPAYLFLLLWWGVMIAPALLSRSASLGFIFEVWRRGVGAQPVSFLFPALAIVHGGLFIERLITRSSQKAETPKIKRPALYFISGIVVVLISAGLSYWLYFVQWANSGAIPALFAESPVRLVEWMETADEDTLFLFPIRPNVSPTTRPELFTVRYQFDGPANAAFPVMDEDTVGDEMTELLAVQPSTVKLMLHNRIAVDPKNYFAYALNTQGVMVGQEQMPDYDVITYQMNLDALDTSLESTVIDFADTLRLTGQQIQPDDIAAGQNLGVALRWQKLSADTANINTRLTLYDAQDYAWATIDQPLLDAENYATTQHWPPDTESTMYYTLPVSADAPPGDYVLRGLAYNAETGAPLSPSGSETTLADVPLQANPNLVDPTKLEMAQPLDVTFPNGLSLVGVNPVTGPAKPGDQFWLTLWWRVDKDLAQALGVVPALAVLDGEPTPLLDRPQPLLADFSTQDWQAGQIYRANYALRLPATLETNDYLLALRLFDLGTLAPQGEQLLFPLSVEARPHLFDMPLLASQPEVAFEDTVQLRSFEIAAPSAEEVNVNLQWQALRPINESYKIFLHLMDAEGQIISQLDTWPQQGAALTTSWLPDEIIEDELFLTLPANVSPGPYRLVVGVYNPRTGTRLLTGQQDYATLFEGDALYNTEID